MKIKALFIINAILALVMGVACVIAPAQLLSSYDVTLSPMGLVIYQFWGAALVGMGLLIWLTRNIQERKIKRALTFSLFCVNGISCAIAIRGQYAGANTLGWSTVTLFALLALGYGLFLIMRSNERS